MQQATLDKIKLLKAEGLTFNQIGAQLGMKWWDVRNAYTRKIKPAMTKQTNNTTVQVKAVVGGSQSDTEPYEPCNLPTVLKLRETMSTRQEILELKKLASERAYQEELLQAIRELNLEHISSPLFEERGTTGNANSTGVLLISDVHLGQQTPGRLTSGYEYNLDVTKAQFDLLYQQVAQAIEVNGWQKLIILDLGDTVDGDDMRPSQHRHVGPLVVEQCALYGRLLAQFISSLLHSVLEIHVERVPGNHARTSQRPGLAGLAEIDPMDSYDWLAGEFTREILRESIEAGRVTINNNQGIYSTIQLYEYNVLFEHGSSLRGSGGALGIPFAGAHKALQGYRDLEGDISLYCLGHFHQPYSFNLFFNTVVCGNGAFPATSPYVVSSKKTATRPSQTLITVEQGKGVTAVQNLWLDTKRKGK